MRLTVLILLSLGLSACDTAPDLTPLQDTCRQIALGRIKHPDSYEGKTVQDEHYPDAKITTNLGFTAWNGYKVPVPYSIACSFQQGPRTTAPTLLNIHWNGRPIRQTELDEIRVAFNLG
tara:strand:- start:813 stop:1169 length:357 start_codon:yes stop_codon:yes gene_type:complete